MLIDLTGRVAVITGAAQGIGAGTARRLAASGASVVVADIQEARGREVVAAIKHAGGVASFVYADVSEERQIEAMVDAAVAHYGRLDILVNNAHFEVHGSATEISAEDWDRSYAVLVRALFLGAKYVIPHLRAQGGGSIVNIASVLGRHAKTRYVTYTSAKAAVAQLSRQLALDYGPDAIRVNTVTPGVVLTESEPSSSDAVLNTTPLRRAGLPADIANAVCFLVSDQADFITGADLLVDGGITVPFAETIISGLEAQRKGA